MPIIEPSSGKQTAAAVRAAAQIEGPVYLSFHKDKPIITNTELEQTLEVAKGQLLLDGDDPIIFASGHLFADSLIAADLLSKSGIRLSVDNMRKLKHFYSDFFKHYANRTVFVFTAENHSIIGGLGSTVAEVLTKDPIGGLIKFKRIEIF